jgi:peptidoglycan/LPS O-acetylase OafA/YrhL
VRRALKLLPPLVVVVVIPTLVYAAARGVDSTAVLSQLFFFFNWLNVGDGSPGRVLPGSGVLWSLAIEEQFYIVFALIWLLLYRSRRYVTGLVALSVVAIVVANVSRLWYARDPGNTWRIYFGTDTRLDAIALGVLSATLYHGWLRGSTRFESIRRFLAGDVAFASAIALYLFSLIYRDPWFRDTLRFSLQSIAACTVILFGLLAGGSPGARLMARVSGWPLVRLIGLASYSLYLVHAILIAAIEPAVWKHPEPLRVGAFVVVSMVAGVAVYLVVEVPFERIRARLHRDLDPNRAASAQPLNGSPLPTEVTAP